MVIKGLDILNGIRDEIIKRTGSGETVDFAGFMPGRYDDRSRYATSTKSYLEDGGKFKDREHGCGISTYVIYDDCSILKSYNDLPETATLELNELVASNLKAKNSIIFDTKGSRYALQRDAFLDRLSNIVEQNVLEGKLGAVYHISVSDPAHTHISNSMCPVGNSIDFIFTNKVNRTLGNREENRVSLHTFNPDSDFMGANRVAQGDIDEIKRLADYIKPLLEILESGNYYEKIKEFQKVAIIK